MKILYRWKFVFRLFALYIKSILPMNIDLATFTFVGHHRDPKSPCKHT